MERETGIEPATNSLEGCDSTTELLPPSRLLRSLIGASARQSALHLLPVLAQPPCRPRLALTHSAVTQSRYTRSANEWWGGEGSNLRSR